MQKTCEEINKIGVIYLHGRDFLNTQIGFDAGSSTHIRTLRSQSNLKALTHRDTCRFFGIETETDLQRSVATIAISATWCIGIEQMEKLWSMVESSVEFKGLSR